MKGQSLPNRECVRLRQVTVGRTHLTYRRVTQRQVPLKFKGPRLYKTDREMSWNTEGRDYPRGIPPLGDVPSDDVSRLRGPQKRFERRRSRPSRPEMIDNPDMLRVTKSRRRALTTKKKKSGRMGEIEARITKLEERIERRIEEVTEMEKADLIRNRGKKRRRVDFQRIEFQLSR